MEFQHLSIGHLGIQALVEGVYLLGEIVGVPHLRTVWEGHVGFHSQIGYASRHVRSAKLVYLLKCTIGLLLALLNLKGNSLGRIIHTSLQTGDHTIGSLLLVLIGDEVRPVHGLLSLSHVAIGNHALLLGHSVVEHLLIAGFSQQILLLFEVFLANDAVVGDPQ